MNGRCMGLWPLLVSLGCVVWIREPEAYREELVELVEAHDEAITACYEDLLERRQLEFEKLERADQGPYVDIGPAVEARMAPFEGDVVMDFVAAPKTGEIAATVVSEATTVPPEVVACVSRSVSGLRLEPADQREGRVALSFQLQSGERRPRPSQEQPEAGG